MRKRVTGMKKEKENFEKKLRYALHEHPVTVREEHFESTILLSRKEADLRNKRVRISYARFWWMQIKFIGWKIWGMQFAFLFVINGIVSHYCNRSENLRYMTRLLSCMSILIFMTALPFLYRSVRYRMQEVEAASRFSAVKLLAARLAVVGIGNAVLLGGMLAVTVIRTSLQAGSVVLYLYFPFLLAGGGCLFMLGHLSPEKFLAGSVGLCAVLLLGAAAVPKHFEIIFRQSFSAGWLAVCVALLIFCAEQFHYIVYRSSYMELQVA